MPGPVLAGCWGYSSEKGRSNPVLMSLEGKRPPLSLHDEPELVREEQVVRRGGGFRQRNGMCEGPGAGGTGGGGF